MAAASPTTTFCPLLLQLDHPAARRQRAACPGCGKHLAIGSLAFGLGVVRSRVLPPGGAMLVGLFGVLGMALLSAPDLAEWLLHRAFLMDAYPVVRMAGFLAMLPYGSGWIWLGYGLWQPPGGRS